MGVRVGGANTYKYHLIIFIAHFQLSKAIKNYIQVSKVVIQETNLRKRIKKFSLGIWASKFEKIIQTNIAKKRQ